MRPGCVRPRAAAFANDIQRFLVEQTRLGIPAIVHEESVAGLTARDATQFPQAIGLASTWNPALLEAMGRVIRAQMLAVGARQTLAPVLDVARDPRWGRIEETYGEDPYLASRLGVGVRARRPGRRSAPRASRRPASTSSATGVRRAASTTRRSTSARASCARCSPRPFEAAIREAGLASVMNAYNEIDGLPCAGAAAILDDLLRDELGFDGVVVADYFAVGLLAHLPPRRRRHERGRGAHGARSRARRRAAAARLLRRAAARATSSAASVPIALVDRAVRRVLRLKFALGLFEQPYVDAAARAAASTRPPRSARWRATHRRSSRSCC